MAALPVSPFEAAAQQERTSTDEAAGTSQRALRTQSGNDTTSSALGPEPRGSGEVASFGQGAAALGRRTSVSGSGEPSDAIRRFSSAGSQIILMQSVVNRFQELVKLAGEAYIDPALLTRVRDLGEGAFAKVVHCKLQQPDGSQLDVAVKLLKPALFSSDLDVSDFVKEGIILKRTRHPSVVRVIGLGFKSADNGRGASPDSLFIVQELCLGGALRDTIALQMFRPTEIVYRYADGMRWAVQIAKGLAHLHAQIPVVMHRDIKLDNILLTGEIGARDAKIGDFGLHATVEAQEREESVRQLKRLATKPTDAEQQRLNSKVMEHELDAAARQPPTARKQLGIKTSGKLTPSAVTPVQSAEHSPNGAHSTSSLFQRMFTMRKRIRPRHDLTGQTGSFLNMAPEVVLGQKYNELADVFSLAIVLYEIFSKSITAASVILTGGPLECQDYAFKVARGYRRPTPMHWPPELALLVTQCWAQDCDARPHAAQVVERLEAIQASGAIGRMDSEEAAALARRGRKGGCCFGGGPG